MLFHFIRHAPTTLGEQGIHQFSDTPLSPTGRLQAKQAAERLSLFEIDCIVSSTFVRARETATIINKFLSKPLLLSELLIETKRPSEMEGKYRNDPAVLAIESEMKANAGDQKYRYSDEETIFMLRLRAQKALDHLVSDLGKRVLVVLHGDILRMLITLMQHGSNVHPELFLRFRNFAVTTHTGITICYFDKNTGWHLVSWNDRSHLQ